MDRTRSIRYSVLGLLSCAGEGLHGWAVKRHCDQIFGSFWQIHIAEIYRVLDRLKHEGLAEQLASTSNTRPRKIFRITNEGLEAFREFLEHDPRDVPRPLRDELAVQLLFANRTDLESTLNRIARQRAVYIQQLHAVVQQRRRSRPAWADDFLVGLLMDGAELHIRAEVAWLDRLATKLRERLVTA